MALVSAFDYPEFDARLHMDLEEALYEARISESINTMEALFNEADVLLMGYQNNDTIVVEDVEIGANKEGPNVQKNVKGIMAGIKNFLEKIIKFLKEALNNFVEGVTRSLQDGEEWYKQNAKYLERNSIPPEVQNSIKVSCIPYWTGACHGRLMENKLPMDTTGFQDAMKKIGTEIDKLQTKDDIYKRFFPELYKLDAKDPRRAAFAYYQGVKMEDDKTNPIMVEFNRGEAMDAIDKMKMFINGEYRRAFNATQDVIKNNTREMENLNNQIARGTAEAMYLKDALYSQIEESSMFALFDVVDENGMDLRKSNLELAIETEIKTAIKKEAPAEGGGETQPKQGEPQEPPKPAEAPKKEETTEDQGKKDTINKLTNYVFEIGGKVATARMSVCKDILDHYVSILQQVVDGIKKYKGIKDEEKENAKYNKDQEQREKQEYNDRKTAARRAYKIRHQDDGVFRKAYNFFFGRGTD
jgi:hypothetical protein